MAEFFSVKITVRLWIP